MARFTVTSFVKTLAASLGCATSCRHFLRVFIQLQFRLRGLHQHHHEPPQPATGSQIDLLSLVKAVLAPIKSNAASGLRRRGLGSAARAAWVGVLLASSISAQQQVQLPQQWEGTVSAPNKRVDIYIAILGNVHGFIAASMVRMDAQRGEVPVFPGVWQMPDTETVRVIDTTGNARFEGKLSADRQSLYGRWIEGPTSLPLTLKPATTAALSQSPAKEGSDQDADIETLPFRTTTGATYDAKLYRPHGRKRPPAAVFIPGGDVLEQSDPLTQMVVAFSVDRFARHGLAVFWIQYKGQGKLNVPLKMAGSDVASAVEALRKRTDMDARHIGVIGYGGGGIAALLSAAGDPKPDFLVLLATPLVPGDQAQAQRVYGLNREFGASEQACEHSRAMTLGLCSLAKRGASEQEQRQWLDHNATGAPEDRRKLEAALLTLERPRALDYLRLDVSQTLSRVTVPTLAIYGLEDLQTPAAPNLTVFQQAALRSPGNSKASRTFPKLDHLFRSHQPGDLPNYSFDDVIYDTAIRWIDQH